MASNLASYSFNSLCIDRLYEQLQNHGKLHASISFPFLDTTLQIIKIGSYFNIHNCASRVAILKSSHNYYIYKYIQIFHLNMKITLITQLANTTQLTTWLCCILTNIFKYSSQLCSQLLVAITVQQTLPLTDNPQSFTFSSVRVLMYWRHKDMPSSPILLLLTCNTLNEGLPVIIIVLLATADSGAHLSQSSSHASFLHQ